MKVGFERGLFLAKVLEDGALFGDFLLIGLRDGGLDLSLLELCGEFLCTSAGFG